MHMSQGLSLNGINLLGDRTVLIQDDCIDAGGCVLPFMEVVDQLALLSFRLSDMSRTGEQGLSLGWQRVG